MNPDITSTLSNIDTSMSAYEQEEQQENIATGGMGSHEIEQQEPSHTDSPYFQLLHTLFEQAEQQANDTGIIDSSKVAQVPPHPYTDAHDTTHEIDSTHDQHSDLTSLKYQDLALYVAPQAAAINCLISGSHTVVSQLASTLQSFSENFNSASRRKNLLDKASPDLGNLVQRLEDLEQKSSERLLQQVQQNAISIYASLSTSQEEIQKLISDDKQLIDQKLDFIKTTFENLQKELSSSLGIFDSQLSSNSKSDVDLNKIKAILEDILAKATSLADEADQTLSSLEPLTEQESKPSEQADYRYPTSHQVKQYTQELEERLAKEKKEKEEKAFYASLQSAEEKTEAVSEALSDILEKTNKAIDQRQLEKDRLEVKNKTTPTKSQWHLQDVVKQVQYASTLIDALANAANVTASYIPDSVKQAATQIGTEAYKMTSKAATNVAQQTQKLVTENVINPIAKQTTDALTKHGEFLNQNQDIPQAWM